MDCNYCETCPRNELTKCLPADHYKKMVRQQTRLATTTFELASIATALEAALEALPSDMNRITHNGLPLDLVLWGCSNRLHRVIEETLAMDTEAE